MKNRILLIAIFVFNYSFAQEQKKDTITLEEIIVSATKTKRQLSNITVPVTLIKQKDLKTGASLSLQDVLGEFTGLEINSTALGAGIQLQGLDASYTLIMIDGQPLIGRLNGTLDLSRLSVENIKQIEIVNGPSSVLYGSEALAGVVNIITKKSKKENLSLGSKISSFDTYNFSANAGFVKNKLKASFFTNYYTTNGYNINSNYEGISSEFYGKTVSPHQNYTFTSNLKYQLNETFDFDINARFFGEHQDFDFLESNLSTTVGTNKVSDWNITPTIRFKPNNKLSSSLLVYLTKFNSDKEEIKADNTIKTGFFAEKYARIELQNDYKFNKKHAVTFGLGYANESVATSNLANDSEFKATNTYGYVQYLFDYNKKLNIVAGMRFDKHDSYTNQFNPKLSLSYRIKPTITVNASIGRGFKKPTFKQLYLNYVNNAVGVIALGTSYAEEGITDLLNANQIAIDPETNQPIIYDLYHTIIENGGVLEPESSIGMNLGFKISSIAKTIIGVNLFRNDLENLIEFSPIALNANGRYVYSSENIKSVYSQGLTLNVKYRISEKYKILAGYQYLDTKDKDVLKQLDGEGIYAQNPETLSAYRVSKKDYGGLLNRSKHTANIKFFASDFYKGFDANFRLQYKGRFGYVDGLNNNQILDIDDEYIDAYFLANTSISKKFLKNKLRIQLGIDNLFDFTYATPAYTISSLPGRTYYTTINYKF